MGKKHGRAFGIAHGKWTRSWIRKIHPTARLVEDLVIPLVRTAAGGFGVGGLGCELETYPSLFLSYKGAPPDC